MLYVDNNMLKKQNEHDEALMNINGLAWLPWIPDGYASRPDHQKLLIVGESHYYRGNTPEERRLDRDGYNDVSTTRTMVDGRGWGTKTWSALPKLLFDDLNYDDQKLWTDTAYYNFVQRPLNHSISERPSAEDFRQGWAVFNELIQIMKPSHCLFIGVESTNHYSLGDIYKGDKLCGVYPRTATLNLGDYSASLVFIHHLGRCKDRDIPHWHNYLVDNHDSLFQWLKSKPYTE